MNRSCSYATFKRKIAGVMVATEGATVVLPFRLATDLKIPLTDDVAKAPVCLTYISSIVIGRTKMS